ncbi:HopJ type III effector protein [Sphingobacterium detergens]|uniref:HopJ type III effector protein n=1 Tax=Sphingobacterium detergens TaxID=1145106 RepID=A0A420ADR1_SPHD1|nr:HopJ type III effector protein [Sphingobacterium detergens]RKE42658.1 HopJ type III effector protein [Sphingobacterium detergens]
MKTEELLAKSKGSQLQFQEVLDHIAEQYTYSPTPFQNGNLKNSATENQGSAKVLHFAKLNELSVADTLLLFAEHYQNVLDNPVGEGHQNIRQFMANGWDGVVFEADVLTDK